jgi:hypothetical protein
MPDGLWRCNRKSWGIAAIELLLRGLRSAAAALDDREELGAA